MPLHNREDDESTVCPQHSGLSSRVSMLLWLLGGLGGLGLWSITLLYNIKDNLGDKASAADVVRLQEKATESKIRIEAVMSRVSALETRGMARQNQLDIFDFREKNTADQLKRR